jgi:hypothetical protein
MPVIIYRSAPEIAEVRTPLNPAMLERLPSVQRLQFCGSRQERLNDSDFATLNSFFRASPETALRVIDLGKSDNLEFVRLLPNMRHFSWDCFEIRDVAGLRHLPPQLESLGIGSTRHPVNLAVLPPLPALDTLYVSGRHKCMERLSGFTTLTQLNLSYLTLPDLKVLLPLRRLRALSISLGGTKNLDLLPDIGKLRHLALCQILGITNIDSVSRLMDLEYLFIQNLPKLTHLPALTRLKRLKRVDLHSLKQIRDLSPLLQARALRELVVCGTFNLTADDFAGLKQHPSLRYASIFIGKARHNVAIQQLLGLSPVSDMHRKQPP